jgi:hypothetical protein
MLVIFIVLFWSKQHTRTMWVQMWSPSLVPTPSDYGNHIDVIGNVFPPLPVGDGAGGTAFTPPVGLEEWLAEPAVRQADRGASDVSDPPVFVGFGSMVIKVGP